MDIYSGRGIVFTVDEFLNKIINGKNKKAIVEVIVEAITQNAFDYLTGVAPESFDVLCNLKPNMKLAEIKEIIASVGEVDGEGSDCYVVDSDAIEALFDKILEVSGHDLPPISEVTAWGSGRYNGWDTPKGVACVVFDSDSCFERKLSDQGKAVKKLFGSCDETEWTEMSV